MPNANSVILRPLNQDDSLDELTALLHRAYKPLADQGMRFLATHQSVQVTRDRISTGHCIVAELDGNVIGTITWYHGPHRDPEPKTYNQPGTAYFGQFAVEPDHQQLGIGRRMIEHVEQCAQRAGCDTLALDTAETARSLIDWYERLGFRFVEFVQSTVTNYRSVVMSKSLK